MPVRPGDPLRIKADEYNAAVEAGQAWRAGVTTATSSEQRPAVQRGTWSCWVRKGSNQPDEVQPGEFLSFDQTPRGFAAADQREGGPLQHVTDGPIYLSNTIYNAGQYGYRWPAHGIAPNFIGRSSGGSTSGLLLLEGLLWVWAKIIKTTHSYVRPAADARIMETCDTHGHLIRWKPGFSDPQDLPAERWMLAEIRTLPCCPVLHGRAKNNIFPGQGGTVTLLDGTDIYGCQYEHITGSGQIDAGVNVNIQWWWWKNDFYIVDADCN